jgi:hypothetical protein
MMRLPWALNRFNAAMRLSMTYSALPISLPPPGKPNARLEIYNSRTAPRQPRNWTYAYETVANHQIKADVADMNSVPMLR